MPLDAIAAAIKAKKMKGDGVRRPGAPEFKSGKSRISPEANAAHALAPKGKARPPRATSAAAAAAVKDLEPKRAVRMTGADLRREQANGSRVATAELKRRADKRAGLTDRRAALEHEKAARGHSKLAADHSSHEAAGHADAMASRPRKGYPVTAEGLAQNRAYGAGYKRGTADKLGTDGAHATKAEADAAHTARMAARGTPVVAAAAPKAKRKPSALAQSFSEERRNQDLRFEAATGGGIAASDTHTDEYKKYFGLGTFAGMGTESRLTLGQHMKNNAKNPQDKLDAAAHSAGMKLGARHAIEGGDGAKHDAEFDHHETMHSDAKDAFGSGYGDGLLAGARIAENRKASAPAEPKGKQTQVIGSLASHGEIVTVEKTNGQHRVKIDGRQHFGGHPTREAAVAAAHSLVPEHRRADTEAGARKLHVDIQAKMESDRKAAVAARQPAAPSAAQLDVMRAGVSSAAQEKLKTVGTDTLHGMLTDSRYKSWHPTVTAELARRQAHTPEKGQAAVADLQAERARRDALAGGGKVTLTGNQSINLRTGEVTEGGSSTKTHDLGNNESRSTGISEHSGTFTALTHGQSRTFKTRAGAERWLSGRGYNPDGSRGGESPEQTAARIGMTFPKPTVQSHGVVGEGATVEAPGKESAADTAHRAAESQSATRSLKPGDLVDSEYGPGVVKEHTDRTLTFRTHNGETLNMQRGTPGYFRVTPMSAESRAAHPDLVARAKLNATPLPPAPAGVRIEHSGDGTLVHGTEKGDTATNAALKAQGFKWSRNLNAWYQPRNIGEPVRAQRARALHSALGGEGGKSSLHVGDLAHTQTPEQITAGRVESATQSAERNRARAEALRAEADRRYGRSRAATEGIPFGQPILVGHHSESRHRNAIARSNSEMRKSIEADRGAADLEHRAQSAEARARMAVDPKAAARRLDRNEAELRKVQRSLHGTGKEIYGTNTPATGEHADRLAAMEKDLQAKIAADRAVVGEGNGLGKHNVQPGDIVRVGGSNAIVHSTGPKNVKIHTSVGPLPYPYSQISGHGSLDTASTERLEQLLQADQAKTRSIEKLSPAVVARIEAILAARKKG